MSKILKINGNKLEKKLIQKASVTIEKGGIVICPAKSFYGISADVFNKEAIDKIFKMKNRDFNKPILILIKDKSLVKEFAKDISPLAEKIMDRFWPGNLTIVLKAKKHIPENITQKSGKIGIRVPANKITSAILKNTTKKAITGTSANISGNIGCCDINKLDKKILKESNLILDAGVLSGNSYSTVIDCSSKEPILLRKGSIKKEEIYKASFTKRDL